MIENICAPATPYGSSAIGIIRCSGPEAIQLVNTIFKGHDLTKVASHTIHYGFIMDQNEVLDEVLCNVYLEPTSFDGENMVEINCHGGTYVMQRILNLLLKNGFRMAEHGEFSKRAFLNKKLDLTQAEAIMDIIAASNSIALRSSQNSLRNSTSHLIRKFREKLLDILAKIEVNIDYPEYEDSVEVTKEYLEPVLKEVCEELSEILKTSEISKLAIHGIKTAIVGKPNVGKSSLLNLLLDEEKAIVTDIPGTTRDLVEGSLNLGNMTLHLIDTAGIRESEDTVERIGIERSNQVIESADLVLLVLDVSKTLDDVDQQLMDLTKNKKRIIVANKSDQNVLWNIENMVLFSCENKTGIEELANQIQRVTQIEELNIDEGKYLSNARQTDLMSRANQSLHQAWKACEMGMDIDLVEIDIKQAFEDLGAITGDAIPDELITALFTKFCLGK
ncbi:MAG: tRNA uridine-5-carboxymethylaminomethyl(34) synthesis GTPase MnmE [Anaeroplasmataceae bacterium]|nr:tRNA uridine-5-carboxymethylaminomethyl(34) synthesis GTPase MnmE [Anaeroplasmataceae bacterium]